MSDYRLHDGNPHPRVTRLTDCEMVKGVVYKYRFMQFFYDMSQRIKAWIRGK